MARCYNPLRLNWWSIASVESFQKNKLFTFLKSFRLKLNLMKITNTQKQSRIFHKIVCQNGRFFSVRFVILDREGRLRGKIISCEPVEVMGVTDTVKEKYLLPLLFLAQNAPVGKACFQGIISPFSKLEFLTSIQIRAPAHSK